MAAWRDRVAVAEFNLLGGEPTIHPRLPEFVTLVRRHWPAAYIRIITVLILSAKSLPPKPRSAVVPMSSYDAIFSSHPDVRMSVNHGARRAP